MGSLVRASKSAHVDADQFGGGDSDHGGQRAVHAQNFVGFIVHDDQDR